MDENNTPFDKFRILHVFFCGSIISVQKWPD